MDCLVCHDTTGTYKKAPTKAGFPEADVDLKHVAQQVGHTSRASCGACHFSGGGGDAIKHADMGSNLKDPDPRCDVHMGDLDFTCAECHTTRQHRIAGRSSSVAPAEGVVRCEDCHSDKPHSGNSLLDHHLNQHGKSMSCNTCHSPVYAKCAPTKTWWDWSKAGDLERVVRMERLGDSDPLPDYDAKKGEFGWKRAVKPGYHWYNGHMERINLGDAAALERPIVKLTAPIGSIDDPRSRITPFKIMQGVQAFDAQHKTLLIPHLFPSGPEDESAYWKNYVWRKAFLTGMEAAELPFSGNWRWKETWTFWRVEHEVMPAAQALSCKQCHTSLREEQTCNRCHQDSRHVDFKQLAHKDTDFSFLEGKRENMEELHQGDYLDFEGLGYKGDPIIFGGRFKQLPLGRKEDMGKQEQLQ